MKVAFHETVEDPIFAYTLKDLKGTEITGTNTMFEKSASIRSMRGVPGDRNTKANFY